MNHTPQLSEKELIQKHSKSYFAAKKDIGLLSAFVKKMTAPVSASFKQKICKPACENECSYCCHLRVVAYSYEVIAIHVYLNTHAPEDIKKVVKDNIQAQYEKVKNLTEEEHFTTNVQCPFLIDQSCSIYKARPISCANYHSTNKTDCIKSYENPSDFKMGRGMNGNIERVNIAQHTIVQSVLAMAKDDLGQYELISSMYKLMKSPGLIQKWKAGKKFFE